MIAAATLLFPAWASTQESDPGAPDEKQAEEREQAQKLRRSREELELRRNETARRLEAEQLRQAEIRRLEDTRAAIGRRESYLGHEISWTQRERDSLQWKDPTDLSSFARRSTLDHRVYHYSNELERASTLRQGVTTQLNSLQRR